MKTEFNHAANDSPRSGSSKKVTPAVWAVIVVAYHRRHLVHDACVMFGAAVDGCRQMCDIIARPDVPCRSLRNNSHFRELLPR